jgi:hypothetical protein
MDLRKRLAKSPPLEDQIAGVTEGLASADPSEAHPSIDPILRTLLSTGCLQAALDLSRRLLRSLLPDDVGLMAHAAAAFWFADQDDTAEGEIETAWQIDPAGTSAAMQMLVESGVVSEKFLDLAPA